MVVRIDIFHGFQTLRFLVEGENLAFDIFGYDLNFTCNLFLDFLSDRFNIQLTLLMDQALHIAHNVLNGDICCCSHFDSVVFSENGLFQNKVGWQIKFNVTGCGDSEVLYVDNEVYLLEDQDFNVFKESFEHPTILFGVFGLRF